MYKQRLANPYYLKNGVKHTTFNIRNKAGVYLIYESDIIVYVGYSASNLYKTMYRHFESWGTSKQYRATYNPNNVKVRVVYTRTGTQASNLETALIIKIKPRDNVQQYIDFETEPKEDKAYKEYIENDIQPIAEYEGDIPF